MTPEYNLCDVCGCPTPCKARTWIKSGSQMGATGTEDAGRTVDLCVLCACALLNTAAEKSDIGVLLLNKIDAGKKAHSKRNHDV